MKTMVTFGGDHIHKIGNQVFDQNCVAVIESEGLEAGRAKAFELFGKKFSMEYPEHHFNSDMKYFPRGFIEVEPATSHPITSLFDVEVIDVGDSVICDSCGDDYTDSDRCGGILFESKAICPNCSPKWISNAKTYSEMHFIKAECPEGKTFADWVRGDLR